MGFGEIPSFLKQDVVNEGKEIWSIVKPKTEPNEENIRQDMDISDRLNEQDTRVSASLHEASSEMIPEGIPSFRVPPREINLEEHASLKYPSTASVDAISRPENAPLQQNTFVPTAQTSFSASPYQVIGQLFSCYLVIQQGDMAFFIDQHAAHERKLYEQMMHKELGKQAQLLLMPKIETLTAGEYTLLQDNIELFTDMGFDIEPFGATSISIRAVPYLFGEPQAMSFLHEAIDMLDKKNRCNTKELKRSMIIQQACKHAIKAGALLDETQIRALLDDFQRDGIPLTCPHGRPIMVQMRKVEFERLFKRLV